MPVPKTFILWEVQCLSQCDAGLCYQAARTVVKARETTMNYFVRIF
jgi:hypothetical protein